MRAIRLVNDNFKHLMRSPVPVAHACAMPPSTPPTNTNPAASATNTAHTTSTTGMDRDSVSFSPESSTLDLSAQLVSRPATLHVLWTEFQFGIGMNKPAKLFTPRESGDKQNKFKYSLRKKFGLCVPK